MMNSYREWGGALNEVGPSTESVAEFTLHFREVEKRVSGLRPEADEHVDVAVGREVGTQHRAEKCEFRDLPSCAERL